MTTVDWVEHDPEGFAPGTTILHHAPTCAEVPGHYVQPSCSHWSETILIPMTEGPWLDELPATGSDLFGMILLAAALVTTGAVAWAVDRVKRAGRDA